MRLARSLILFLAMVAVGTAAQAQSWPAEKPIRVVNGFAAGGGTDLLLRALLPRLSELVGQQMIVDYRPGAGGNLAMEIVAKASPDGYTLLMGSPGLATNPSLYASLTFDPLRDFAPISLVGVVQNVLIVHPSLRVGSVAELIALARQQPGKLNYASPGYGTSLHLAAELFRVSTGVDLVHVPYKGGLQAVTDVLAGQPELMFNVLPSALPHIKSGGVRALAVTGSSRAPTLPELPTMIEAGVPGYTATTWNGLLAPAGTPAPIVGRLHDAIVAALQDPGVLEGYARLGQDAAASTPAEFMSLMRDETAKWSRVIKAANIQAQ